MVDYNTHAYFKSFTEEERPLMRNITG